MAGLSPNDYMKPMFLPLLLSLTLQQSTPSGGAIRRYVPAVPTPASFISDQADVIPEAAQSALDDRIRQIQRDGFGDVAVAILPSIGDYAPTDVAVEIYRTWKVGSVAAIGSAHRNVGVLLLIVPKELAPNKRGECWINPGTGAEGIITDATAAAICRDSIIPHLKTRDYPGAVGAGIAAIEGRLRGDVGLAEAPSSEIEKPGQTNPESTVAPLVVGGILTLVLAVVGTMKWRRYHARKCPRCGRQMRRLSESDDRSHLDPGRRKEEELESVDYDVWVCDCGNELQLPYKATFTNYSNCRECGRRTAKAERTILSAATTVSSGMAEDRFTCSNCGATWTVTVVLPMISTSSSSGSSHSGGGGGGGGDSFGGSGSDSGGGGGSSY
jgi:uncharacterized protein